VKHKEHIKTFRNKIDVLTLTATPIPRTLQLSMTGIRDLSVINTPPLDRKAVHTILCNFDEQTIRNAIMKELSRHGQVFFLHNRVESIYTMKQFIEKIVPEARIKVGHGQMNQQELEKTMLGFLNHEFDVLLCTTIIESGMDIPNANTLLVNRADTFGLAQLYQIRGRVGRSHQEAYAYFMVPDQDRMSRDAIKRLKILKQFTDLGSGLKISLHDMEIRGAGNLLGSKQSGQISTVGFELYSQLLEREVRKLKGEKIKDEIEPEIQVNIAAYIPDNYIPEQTERLRFYKRLSGCKNEEEMSIIKTEMIDRFGALPPVVENLVEVVDLKMVARESGVVALKISGFAPTIEFSDQAPINIDKLLAMARKNPNIRMTPDHKLHLGFESDIDPILETKKILASLRLHGKT
ncbi:MAG: transcription-repair coupling factor, partial [Proteobacteria bacterium]|nr:transcription-repair coupling factor [Pseudomonadota bacterium]